MTYGLQNLAIACSGAVLLAGAFSAQAYAYYTGYGNGDPGNWGFAMEQKGGPCSGVKKSNARMPSCCLHYTPQGMCPDMPHGTAYAVPPLSTVIK